MKKLIFDFDGTLVDSMQQWAGKMINILKVYEIDYPDDIVKTITPLGDKGTAEYFINTFKIKSTVQALIKMMDEYALPEYTYNILSKDTVSETLKSLKEQGFSLNVLTASPHKMLDVCLKRTELYDLFDNVWSCDDFGTTKGDVNIYHMAAARMNDTAENCIFLDDNINALSVAKRAGMTTVGVYDKSAEDAKEEIMSLADAYVYEMKELLPILGNLVG